MSLIAHLAQLESSGLVRLAQVQPELEYLFRHALVQEAAHASLVKRDRMQLHWVVGEALERMYPNRIEELAPRLGEHFEEAGDDSRALKYFTLAGDAAARVYANAEAIAHYTRALNLAKRTPALKLAEEQAVEGASLTQLYLKRGRLLELTDRYAEALSHYDDMEALAHERGDRALELSSLIARATVRATPNPAYDPAEGLALSDRALALAEELNDRQAVARILWNLMLLQFYSGHLLEAIPFGEQSLRIARELNLREQMAYTLADLGRLHSSLGHLERARAALQEAHDLWRELDNKPMLANNMAASAGLHYLAGDLERAIALFEESRQLGRWIGNLWVETIGCAVGTIYLERGELSKGIEALREGIRLSEQSGSSMGLVLMPLFLAEAYGRLGDVERALDLCGQSLARSGALNPAARLSGLAVRAWLYVLKGDIAGAEADVEEIHRSRGDALLWSVVSPALVEGELALAKQDYVRAAALMDEAIEAAHKSGIRIGLPDALGLRGRALLAQGHVGAARETLQEARAVAEALGARLAVWPILAALDRIEAQRGNDAEAEVLRRQAREVIDYIADHCPPELRASFFNLPDVREVMSDT